MRLDSKVRAAGRFAWVALLAWSAIACRDAAVVVGKLDLPLAGERSTASIAADGGGAGASGSIEPPAAASGGGASDPIMTHEPPSDGSRDAGQNDAPYAQSIEPGTRDEFCAGKGAALKSTRASAAGADCEYRVERQLFAYALCACDELRFSNDSFVIDSFDSTQDPYKAGQTGLAIGVNGALTQLASDTQVLGSLTVAGAAALRVTGQNFLVTEDFRTNAALQLGASSQRIARDLWLADDVSNTNVTRVDRDVHQSPGHIGASGLSVGGQRDTASVVHVDAPCACGDAALDVAALVAQAHDRNDNATATFAMDALKIDTYTTDLKELPCGRLLVSSVDLQGPSTYVVSASGRTALFVQGDVHVASISTLFVKASDMGELDVFIAGNIHVEQSSSLVLGDAAHPSALRVYVAGQIQLEGALAVAGHLYAPQAALTFPVVTGDTDVYGSILARTLDMGVKRMHYDRAIMHAAPACDAPAPQRCDDCRQCPDDLACKAGTCAACASDADCCEPAVCTNGQCQLLVSNWP
jgi:hypothetical protein